MVTNGFQIQTSTILYLDDDKANLISFELTFAKHYQILVASSAKEAWDILKQHSAQLVIADQRMPQVTGVEFLEQVLASYPSVPRILLTGYNDKEALMKAINKCQVFAYITKPWVRDELKVYIDNAINSYQLKEANHNLLLGLQEANDELIQAENKFSLAFYLAPIALCITEFETGIYTDLNKSYELLTGYRKEELLGKTGIDVGFWKESKEREEFTRLMRSNARVFNREEQITSKNGVVRYVKLSAETISINGVPHILGLCQDITEEKQSKERIVATIIETEDKERQRMAKELHDSLGQYLTVASLNFASVRQEKHQLSKKNQDKLEAGMSYLKSAMQESRSIAHNLMPQVIEDFGYVQAVDTLLESLKKATDITFHFHNNLLGQRLDLKLELSLYRITQESINNILKHAKASSCSIQLIKHEDSVMLTIEDDGKGFDLIKTKNQDFGLTGMQNRTIALQGTFNIETNPGKGTVIIVETPLQNLELYGTD